MAISKIEWTGKTWNPTTGCDKISQGCKFCYAAILSLRLYYMGLPKYINKFKLTLHQDTLDIPKQWKKGTTIFVNSMSDLFHKDVPLEFIQAVFKTMNECPQHTFQVLTKRAERLLELSPYLNWTSNIWMGVSVEDSKVLDRIDYLRQTEAKIKFLSVEPLLEALPNLNLKNIDWVIVGGESGRKPRPMLKDWVTDIKEQCAVTGVPFFFKQWGGTSKKKTGRQLDGRTYDDMPQQLIMPTIPVLN